MSYLTEPQQGLRRHKLLTAEIRKALPAIGTTDGQGMDAIAQVKFFAPYGVGSLYITEFDGEDMLYGYGALYGMEPEWGYSSLSEIAEATFRGRIPAVERDCYWDARPVKEAIGS